MQPLVRVAFLEYSRKVRRLWSYDRALTLAIWLLLAISLTMWLVAVAMLLGRLL